ncbi:hypothetical protein Tco_0473820 [Tanacetum coccineum]
MAQKDGSCELQNLSSGIFTSSSYDDDFRATLTNLAPDVEVNPVPTKRVNTIHPQSQILGDLASPVLQTSKGDKIDFEEQEGYQRNSCKEQSKVGCTGTPTRGGH